MGFVAGSLAEVNCRQAAEVLVIIPASETLKSPITRETNYVVLNFAQETKFVANRTNYVEIANVV